MAYEIFEANTTLIQCDLRYVHATSSYTVSLGPAFQFQRDFKRVLTKLTEQLVRFASFQWPSTSIQPTSNRDNEVYFRLGERLSAYYLLGGVARSQGKFRASEITGKEFISNNREKFLSNFFRHPVCYLHINVHLTKKIVLALHRG